MNVKILRMLLVIFVILTTTGCSLFQQRVKIEYVDRIVEKKVTVPCVVPDANCSFNRETDTEVIGSLLECITEMKKNEEVCK